LLVRIDRVNIYVQMENSLLSSYYLSTERFLYSQSVTRIQSLQTDIMSTNIATKEHIWDYYVATSNYKAKCKFCESELSYVKFANFEYHIRRKHAEIWKYETSVTEDDRLYHNFFKYSYELFIKCIICNEEICVHERKGYHLYFSHTVQERDEHCLSPWPRKYFTQNHYFTVQCNVDTCREIVPITIHNHIHNHIENKHPDKLKNTQETHDKAGPSQRT